MTTPTFGSIALSALLLIGASALVGAVAGQERARSTEDLSHVKQLALGVAIYSADADDLLPPAFAPLPRGGYTAAAKFTGRGSDFEEGRINWGWAIYPYVKSTGIYAAVEAPRVAVVGDPDPKLPGVGHQYNGLLNAYNAAAVASPSEAVMFAQTYGMANLEGWAVSNPEMTCVANHPCVYRPAEKGCGGPEPGTTSRLRALDVAQTIEEADPAVPEKERVKERYQVFARVDTSAKRIRFAEVPAGDAYGAREFFWSRLDAQGRAKAQWTDAFGCHPLRFRPDYDPETDSKNARELGR